MKTFSFTHLARFENAQKKYFLSNMAMLNCLSKHQAIHMPCCLSVLLITNPNFYDAIISHYQQGLILRLGLILKSF